MSENGDLKAPKLYNAWRLLMCVEKGEEFIEFCVRNGLQGQALKGAVYGRCRRWCRQYTDETKCPYKIQLIIATGEVFERNYHNHTLVKKENDQITNQFEGLPNLSYKTNVSQSMDDDQSERNRSEEPLKLNNKTEVAEAKLVPRLTIIVRRRSQRQSESGNGEVTVGRKANCLVDRGREEKPICDKSDSDFCVQPKYGQFETQGFVQNDRKSQEKAATLSPIAEENVAAERGDKGQQMTAAEQQQKSPTPKSFIVPSSGNVWHFLTKLTHADYLKGLQESYGLKQNGSLNKKRWLKCIVKDCPYRALYIVDQMSLFHREKHVHKTDVTDMKSSGRRTARKTDVTDMKSSGRITARKTDVTDMKSSGRKTDVTDMKSSGRRTARKTDVTDMKSSGRKTDVTDMKSSGRRTARKTDVTDMKSSGRKTDVTDMKSSGRKTDVTDMKSSGRRTARKTDVTDMKSSGRRTARKTDVTDMKSSGRRTARKTDVNLKSMKIEEPGTSGAADKVSIASEIGDSGLHFTLKELARDFEALAHKSSLVLWRENSGTFALAMVDQRTKTVDKMLLFTEEGPAVIVSKCLGKTVNWSERWPKTGAQHFLRALHGICAEYFG
uniref:Uncharacterized protein n=1 Tax=Globodera rostochiensis TaxID=31243 RepID=A0A914I1V7_GLORO